MINRVAIVSMLFLAVATTALHAQPEKPVNIIKVQPSKKLYFVGDVGRADIVLYNSGSTTVTGTLMVKEEWGVDESRVLSTHWSKIYHNSRNITLLPHQQVTWSIDWDLGEQLYGHALQATFSVKNHPPITGHGFYQVARKNDWWRMNILSPDEYCNFHNNFAYALSDFCNLAPATDEYYSGQVGYFINNKKLIHRIQANYQRGIMEGGYTQTLVCGPAGYEFARKHPDWILRDERGAFRASVAPLSPMAVSGPYDEPLKGKGGAVGSYYALPIDFGNPETVKYGAEEIIRAIKVLGFKAMFFDSNPYGMGHYGIKDNVKLFTWDGLPHHRGNDPDEMSARSTRRVREIIRQSCPDVVLWYNGVDPTVPHKRKRNIAALDDSHCGVLMEVQIGPLLDPNHTLHHWRALYETFISRRNGLLKEENIHNPILNCGYIGFGAYTKGLKTEWETTRHGWTTANHIGAIFLASCVHPNLYGTDSWTPALQFMTRYSELMWSKEITLLEKPWKTITINSNREVWWEDSVYVNNSGRYHDTLIHIVNSPDQETVKITERTDPVLAESVEIEMQGIRKPAEVQVWAMQPYNYDDSDKTPHRYRLATKVESGKLIVQIPPFRYYTLVVVREPKEGTAIIPTPNSEYYKETATQQVTPRSEPSSGKMVEQLQLHIRQGSEIVRSKGWLQLNHEFIQNDGHFVVLEAENSSVLHFLSDKGAPTVDKTASGGYCIKNVRALKTTFVVNKAGTYQMWYRAWFPLKGNWNHWERMDDGPSRHRLDSDYGPAEKWLWGKGPQYQLSKGRHSLVFPKPTGWCGGALLDKIVISPAGTSTPIGLGPAVSPTRHVLFGEFACNALLLNDASTWELKYEEQLCGGSVRVEYSCDRGETWEILPKGEIKQAPAANIRVCFRFVLEAATDGDSPKLRNLNLVVNKKHQADNV